MMDCPRCGSEHVVRNGYLGNEKPKFKCQECGRQFVEDPKRQPIPEETQALIDKLLLERISLAGIARVTGVSERWLQYYVNRIYEDTPRRVEIKKNERPLKPPV